MSAERSPASVERDKRIPRRCLQLSTPPSKISFSKTLRTKRPHQPSPHLHPARNQLQSQAPRASSRRPHPQKAHASPPRHVAKTHRTRNRTVPPTDIPNAVAGPVLTHHHHEGHHPIPKTQQGQPARQQGRLHLPQARRGAKLPTAKGRQEKFRQQGPVDQEDSQSHPEGQSPEEAGAIAPFLAQQEGPRGRPCGSSDLNRRRGLGRRPVRRERCARLTGVLKRLRRGRSSLGLRAEARDASMVVGWMGMGICLQGFRNLGLSLMAEKISYWSLALLCILQGQINALRWFGA